MYDPHQPRCGRGIAAVLLRQLGDTAGHRERSILAAPDVMVNRWSGSTDCLEFTAEGRACVIRRPITTNIPTIVG